MFWSVKNVRWIFSLKRVVSTLAVVALSLLISPVIADDAPAVSQAGENDSTSTHSKAEDSDPAGTTPVSPDAITDEGTTKPVANDGAPKKPSIWSADGLEDFEFTDRSGKLVTRKDLLGKEWVIGFMFTRCRGPCPMIVAAMKKLRDETQVNMILFTVDPENDTPEVLRRFSESYVPASKSDVTENKSGDAPQWYWLTGPREKLLTYIQKNFRVPAYGRAGEPEHSNSVMHVDESARVMGKYLGVESAEMALLRRIIQKKAPRGKMSFRPAQFKWKEHLPG
jgi:cytochrome oxidase Cu insertion factor (SCO1/SenC/PrrC family)